MHRFFFKRELAVSEAIPFALPMWSGREVYCGYCIYIAFYFAHPNPFCGFLRDERYMGQYFHCLCITHSIWNGESILSYPSLLRMKVKDVRNGDL